MPVNIPSVSVPFTDSNGRISPIWHEFLRSFVKQAETGTLISSGNVSQVVAGNGLVGGGPVSSNVPLRVGQGSGIAVNADDVNVDINGATYALGTLEDEILFSDVSDNNAIRKTRLQDVAGLSSPGGVDTQVQYNNAGSFGGNSSLTYDGISALGLGGILTINGSTFSTATNASKFIFNVPAGTANAHYTFRQTTGTGSSDMPAVFGSSLASTDLVIDSNIDSGGTTTAESRLAFRNKGITKWVMGLEGSSSGSKFVMSVTGLNVGQIYNINSSSTMNHITAMTRSVEAGVTASTTQTQGQGAQTKDIIQVSVCATINDTITLPTASEGRHATIINSGAQTLQIFPASGDDLGAGVNTATTLVAAGKAVYVAYNATNWRQLI